MSANIIAASLRWFNDKQDTVVPYWLERYTLTGGIPITSNSTDYFIYFTFTFHSPVKIDIQLTGPEPTPNASTILGLDRTLFYEIIGGVVAL